MNNLEPATESPNGNRWCTNCEQARSSHGGFWKMNENKKIDGGFVKLVETEG